MHYSTFKVETSFYSQYSTPDADKKGTDISLKPGFYVYEIFTTSPLPLLQTNSQ